MKRFFLISSLLLGLASCGEPTATPMDDAARAEQQQLDSAAEELDASNKKVLDGATKPKS